MTSSVIINKSIRSQQSNDDGSRVVDLIKGDILTLTSNKIYLSRKVAKNFTDRKEGDFVRKDKDQYWLIRTVYEKHQDIAQSMFETIRSWNNDKNYILPE